MTFKSKMQMAYADIQQNEDERSSAYEYALYLIEQTSNDLESCRYMFLEQHPTRLEVFEDCVEEALR